MACDPARVQQGACCDAASLELETACLHLLLSEPLLHAPADELLGCRRDPAHDLPQTDQCAEQVCIEAWLLRINRVQRVYHAARLGEVCQLHQLVLVDHVEASSRADSQHHAQVEQVILLQFID